VELAEYRNSFRRRFEQAAAAAERDFDGVRAPVEATDFIGLALADAERIAERAEIVDVRLWVFPPPPFSAVTADLRPGRLNLLVADGVVLEAGYG
jgi:hypothetical protein